MATRAQKILQGSNTKHEAKDSKFVQFKAWTPDMVQACLENNALIDDVSYAKFLNVKKEKIRFAAVTYDRAERSYIACIISVSLGKSGLYGDYESTDPEMYDTPHDAVDATSKYK